MSDANHDRNLLFGILALQMDFIGRDQLVAAMSAWVMAKHRPLSDLLVEQKALTPERRTLMEALLQEHLKKHDGNLEQSLAAISSIETICADLQQIDDPELQASLAQASVPLTLAPTVDASRGFSSAGVTAPSGTRFRIVRPYAKGGLGEVFVARDEELHREVAVKQIQHRHADNLSSRQRFVLEAEITGGLEHPGIVPVYGLGSYADGRPYYAMRFIRGDSLKEAIERFHGPKLKPVSEAERSLELRGLLGRFIDVCDAIDYAHSRGVLHRDLKPGNIMLGKYGETLVVDWGLAKTADSPEVQAALGESALRPSSGSGSGTLMGSAIGTPQFMSPEQAAGRLDQLGPASDVYSLGATLYCLLTGKTAFEDNDLSTVLRKVESGDFPAPRAIDASVPAALEAACKKAMALAPADRYKSPRALAADIEHWMADEPVSAYQEPKGERIARWMRRHRAWTQSIGAALVLVAIVATVASLLIAQSSREEAAAHQEAERQRQEAVRGFQAARSAVNDYFTEVSENKLLDVPGLQPLRKELLQTALGYYQDFLKQHADDPTLADDVGLTWYRVGRIEYKIGRQSDAHAAMQKALAIQEPRSRAGSGESLADLPPVAALADTYNALGDLAQETTDLDQARQWFTKGRDLRKHLADAKPADVPLLRKLANSDNNLAVVDGKRGELAEAKREYAAANGQRQKLVDEHPDDLQLRRDLAQGQYNFGVLLRDSRDYANARDTFLKAVDAFGQLNKKQPEKIEVRRELAVARRVLGDCLQKLGQNDAALASYEQARQIAEPLARQNPFLTQLRADVAAIDLGVGQVKAQAGDTAAAIAQFQRTRGILEPLTEEDPEVTAYRIDLANCLGSLVELQLGAGRLADARGTLDEARAVRTTLVKDLTDDLDMRRGLGVALDELAVVLWQLNDHDGAIKTAAEATAELRTAFDKSVDLPRFRADLSRHYGNLAALNRQSGKLGAAAAAAFERRKLWRDNPAELYAVAGDLALTANAAAKQSAQPSADETSQSQLIKQSVETLQDAIAAGFDRFDDLKKDPKFKVMADAPSFKALLEKHAAGK